MDFFSFFNFEDTILNLFHLVVKTIHEPGVEIE